MLLKKENDKIQKMMNQNFKELKVEIDKNMNKSTKIVFMINKMKNFLNLISQ